MLESAIERKFMRDVNRTGAIALKFVSPGNRGVPDRLVILPAGHQIFVELKKLGELPSPLQRKWHDRLRMLGHDVRVIDSFEGVNSFVKELTLL